MSTYLTIGMVVALGGYELIMRYGDLLAGPLDARDCPAPPDFPDVFKALTELLLFWPLYLGALIVAALFPGTWKR